MSLEPIHTTNTARVIRERLILVGGLLILIVATLVFPFPMKGRLWGDLFDLAHAPVFCLSLVAIVGFLDPAAAGLPSRFQTIVPMNLRRIAGITFVLMTTGLIGEYLQKFAGRSPSWGDVGANLSGLLAGLCWLTSRKTNKRLRHLLVVTAIGIITAISANPILEVLDSIARMQAFPVLASFERPREIGNWIGHSANAEISDAWSSDGDHSLHVRLRPSAYPGTAMLYLEPDWSEFTQLELDVMNPGEEVLQLVLKLQDEQHSETGFDHHDRFHQEIVIGAGEVTNIVVNLQQVKNAPATRQMDMKQINMIDIFCLEPTSPVSFYIDRLRLVR